jgi:hypothetical protein
MFLGANRNLLSCFNKYLSADKKGLEWSRTDARGPEAFEITEQTPGQYTFSSKFRHFLSAQPNGVVTATATSATTSEFFTISETSPGTYLIKSNFGKYLRAHRDGKVTCDADFLDESVFIRIHPYVQFEGIRKVFYSHHKKYLSVQPNGTLQWNRPAAKASEEFEILKSGDRYAIYTSLGTFLSVNDQGDLIADVREATEKEVFRVVSLGNDMYLLIAWNDCYVTPGPDGIAKCISKKVGQCEPIRITAND